MQLQDAESLLAPIRRLRILPPILVSLRLILVVLLSIVPLALILIALVVVVVVRPILIEQVQRFVCSLSFVLQI